MRSERLQARIQELSKQLYEKIDLQVSVLASNDNSSNIHHDEHPDNNSSTPPTGEPLPSYSPPPQRVYGPGRSAPRYVYRDGEQYLAPKGRGGAHFFERGDVTCAPKLCSIRSNVSISAFKYFTIDFMEYASIAPVTLVLAAA